MEGLGRQLSSAQKSYDGAINKLARGRDNLVGKMQNLESMATNGKKKDFSNRLWQEADGVEGGETPVEDTNLEA